MPILQQGIYLKRATSAAQVSVWITAIVLKQIHCKGYLCCQPN